MKDVYTERETNPRKNANFLSIIFFLFTRNIFKKGLKHGIHERDIYEILDNFRSEKLGDRIEKEWEKEKTKKKRPSLLTCLFRMFGAEYMVFGIVNFVIDTVLITVKPLSIGKVVAYFDPNTEKEMTRDEALFYAFILILSIFCSTLVMHNCMFFIHQLGLKMKIAICSLIYRKSLKLSTPALLKFTSGMAVTLITKDIAYFDFTPQIVHSLWIGLIHVGIMTYIMYKQIEVSAFVGVGFLIILIPIQGLLGRVCAKMRLKVAAKTDKRIRFTQEILNAIKIIKVYTWEKTFKRSVFDIRRKEVTSMKYLFLTRFFGFLIGSLCSKIAMCLCIILYAALGNYITAEQAFVVLSCFGTLSMVLTVHLPLGFGQIAETLAAVKRITEFLNAEEVKESLERVSEKSEPQISLQNVSVVTDGNQTVLKGISLDFKSGLTVITGTVGSGKSFLMKLLMNEVPPSQGTVTIVGRKSYASQDPWLFPETLRENILFYTPLNDDRYQEVIRVCALRKDMLLFPQKDSTIVIDKGMNLSKGQQARINLARAVYREADIYLFDDALCAVDTHVNKYIFEECIQKFLRDKICILITHNVRYLKEAQQIVVLHEGNVQYVGGYEQMPKEILNQIIHEGADEVDAIEIEEPSKKVINEKDDAYEDNTLLKLPNGTDKAPTSIIYQETQQEGKVPLKIYKKYFLLGGGIGTFFILFVLFISSQVTSSWSDTFIRKWVDVEPRLAKYELQNLTNTTEYIKLYEEHDWLLKEYAILVGAAFLISLMRFIAYFTYNARIGLNIHTLALSKILNATMSFFDMNLSGNILNRFSRDLTIVDEAIPFHIQECARIVLMLSGTLVVVITVNWVFIVPSLFLLVVLYFLRVLYLRTGRGVQRLEGITRSPVVGHVNASMDGLLTIRSCEAQESMRQVFDDRQNLFFSSSYMNVTTLEAFGLMADLTTFCYVTTIILSFFFSSAGAFAGNVGLAISQSFMLSGVLQWGICRWAELETRMTSTERVIEYASVEEEDSSGEKPENWPLKGKIVYKHVNLLYPKSEEPVLKDINFTIDPKQKIGIVGRTGAGKSSIIAVLFKLYRVEGSILIDDIDISHVCNETLRNSISIIPQDPVLFSGTLRSNLDPNNLNTDKEIWDALGEVEMKKTISNFESGLETDIPEGGSIFSVGQRQLICLARAILKNNKILVLDEATANVDPQTDALIQKTVRTKFKDCTVLTIAHRLHSIMDSDKVMVVDGGKIIEFDSPNNLKNDVHSIFYGMIKQAGLI